MDIYTIGHSNHTQEKFLALLTKAKIEVLVDVRSNPNSRWAPFANRDSLKDILKAVKLQYVYLGDILGGQPSDSDSYNQQSGKIDYQRVKQKEYFKSGIKRVLSGATRYRVCIMCAEEDPNICHRNLLVALSLREEGAKILHIRGDGRIQTDEELWKEQAGVAASQYPLPL